MSILPNKKHEAFAREVALFNADPDDAYDRLVARSGAKRQQGNGYRLLRRTEVAVRIASLSSVAMEKAAELAGVDRARALAEQSRLAYSNIQDYADLLLAADAAAAGIALKALPRDKAAAIQAISWDSNGRIRIKLHDKVGALANLLRATEPRPPAGDDDETIPADEVARWDEQPAVGARAN
jgi:phage terminase small subunit